MKTIKLLVMLALTTFMVASCSDDDKDTTVSGDTYETTYMKTEMLGADMMHTVEFKTKAELVASKVYMVITLEDDGDFLFDGDKVGTWELDGSALMFTYVIEDEDEDDEMVMNYVLSGNKITGESTFIDEEDGITTNMTIVYTKM